MKIYFSGIGGVAIGPLAEIAQDAGYTVCGSDQVAGLMTDELIQRGITVSFDQSGQALRQEHARGAIDWLVYTAALPHDHPELIVARELGIKTTKRDELLAEIIRDKNLTLLAVSGTHGKTSTAGMLIWALKGLDIPVSYSIGSTLSFGPSGMFDPESEFFVYECDEFDRNFLHFQPEISIITSLDYDHPETYSTATDYYKAFDQFITQSNDCFIWDQDLSRLQGINEKDGLMQSMGDIPFTTIERLTETQKVGSRVKEKSAVRLWVANKFSRGVIDSLNAMDISGQHNRENAYLVSLVIGFLSQGDISTESTQGFLGTFPGTNRRFEKLADNLYSDYGHHPTEIAATLQMARELNDQVVLVYQPHQNIRQHEVRHLYTDCTALADTVYWLPTYLTREDPNLPILSPEGLTADLHNREAVHFAELNDELWQTITRERAASKLVLCMGAGTIDGWVRDRLKRPS